MKSADSIAAVKSVPALTCFQLVPPANVVTGVDLLVTAASPSCPTFERPQVHNVPSVLIADNNISFQDKENKLKQHIGKLKDEYNKITELQTKKNNKIIELQNLND